jgi:hypothetical protein
LQKEWNERFREAVSGGSTEYVCLDFAADSIRHRADLADIVSVANSRCSNQHDEAASPARQIGGCRRVAIASQLYRQQ